MIELEILKGTATKKYIKELAVLRIENFKGYPYLYDGNMTYEEKYLNNFSNNNEAVLYIAKIGNEIVGISTVVPLESEYEIITGTEDKFLEAALNAKDFCYFGEIIIKPQYRGKGIASLIFNTQEEDAKKKGYKGICFLVVDRENDHPLKPIDYIEPDDMWNYMGYKKSEIYLDFEWPTIQIGGGSEVLKNRMVFWIKTIE